MYLKAAFWGFIISLLGSLPLGVLNVAAMQLAISGNLTQAIWFSIGVAIVEVTYVRVSLVAVHWIQRHKKLLSIMDWVAFGIVLMLAVNSFWSAVVPSEKENLLLQTGIPVFLLGMSMSALNPVQIPFWFGWSTVLFSKKVLHANSGCYNYYIFGIAIGTLTGLSVFVFGGAWVSLKINAGEALINYIIGAFFLITAVFQLVKILRNKGLANATEEKSIALLSETE